MRILGGNVKTFSASGAPPPNSRLLLAAGTPPPGLHVVITACYNNFV